MRIYFEDGLLWSGFICDERINGNCGVSECMSTLDKLRKSEIENGNSYTVYTNFPLALDNKYAWDDRKQRSDIFLNVNGRWKNITELTDRTIRRGHNILKLYLAGEFVA